MTDLSGNSDLFDELLKLAGLTHECPVCRGNYPAGAYNELGKQFVSKFLVTQVPWTFYNGVFDEVTSRGRTR